MFIQTEAADVDNFRRKNRWSSGYLQYNLSVRSSCVLSLIEPTVRKLGDIAESAENSVDDGENLIVGSEPVEQLLHCTIRHAFQLLQDVRWILSARILSWQTNQEPCFAVICDVIQPLVGVLKNLARSHVTQWSICQSILKSLIQSFRVVHQLFSVYVSNAFYLVEMYYGYTQVALPMETLR